MGLVLFGGLSASAIAVAISHTAGSPAAPQPAAVSRVTAARTNVENTAPADRRYYPNEFVRRHYPGCRILDRDHDDGCTEIKIRHDGQEKIVLFNHNRWVRTLWEVRRERLPKRVVQALAAAGFGYRSLDDNDNYVMENRRGRFYAVQVQRHDDDDSYYLVQPQGALSTGSAMTTGATATTAATTITAAAAAATTAMTAIATTVTTAMTATRSGSPTRMNATTATTAI